MTSTVPANAATALLGLRVNTECGCNGSADVEIGDVQHRLLAPPAANARAGRIVAQPGQALLLNTPPFPVTPSDAGHWPELRKPRSVGRSGA